MNLHEEGDQPSTLMFATFNQDATALSVGTKNGYRLYNFKDLPERLDKDKEDNSQDYCIVERLFLSSLLGLVSLSSPRKLRVFHFKRNTEITSHCYANTILAVKMNRQRLVVCLEENLHIHNIRDMTLIHTIRSTPPNPQGLIALSPDSDRCFLAYPGHATAGEVQIFDALTLANKITITAHENPLVALAFDSQGVKLATASDKGTVIRVHDVTTGQVLFEFRRGFARCVSIYSLTFSSDSLFLCASSNTETVHIFKLEDPKDKEANAEPESWTAQFTKALTAAAGYLPQANQVMNQNRSFAHAKLPFCGLKNVCALSTDKSGKLPRVLVASADGYLYIYDLNINEGGECTLIKQHTFDDSNVEDSAPLESTLAPAVTGMSYATVVRGCDIQSRASPPSCSFTPGSSPRRDQQSDDE